MAAVLHNLEQLATLMMTPAQSGVCLTRQELLAMARRTDASLRFNERKRMLLDILRSAQDANHLKDMVQTLDAFCEVTQRRYAAWAEEYPASRAMVVPWVGKIAATRTTLARMVAELAE